LYKSKGLSIVLSLINHRSPSGLLFEEGATQPKPKPKPPGRRKLVSSTKYEQLINHNYNYKFNCSIYPPSKQVTLDNHWLAGFTQADGCFYISLVKVKHTKQEPLWECKIRIFY